MHPKRHPSVMGEMCYFPLSFPVVFFHFSKQSRRHPSQDSLLPVAHPADISQTSPKRPSRLLPVRRHRRHAETPSQMTFSTFRRQVPQTRRCHGFGPQTSADIGRHPQTRTKSDFFGVKPYSDASVTTFAARRLRRASLRSHAQRRHQRNSLVRFSRLEKCHAKIFNHLPARCKSSDRYI